ncbi:MAG: hypothetical protein NZ990_15815 [Myxococcota bacterium]|nr:hypothetical protein [Myxococcota bacterium]
MHHPATRIHPLRPGLQRARSGLRPGVRGRFLQAGIGLGILLLAAAVGAAEGDAQAPAGASTLDQQVKEQLDRIPVGEEGVQQIMAELDARLELTDEQKQDVREVVETGVAALAKLRGRFDSGELTAMAFGVQMQMQMRKLGFLVEPLLDPDQQIEYKAMQQQQRRQMMQEMQKQRAKASGKAS